MAIQTSIPVNFEAYFPRGAFMVGEVEPVVKWSDDGQRQGQDLDKNTGHPLRQVRVIDARVAYSLCAAEMKPAPKSRGGE